MNESKTIHILDKYYNILKNEPESEDDKFLACNIEFDLAKSLIQEFGKETCHKLAKILLADEKQNEMPTLYACRYPRYHYPSHMPIIWHEGTPTICMSPQTQCKYADESPRYVEGYTTF